MSKTTKEKYTVSSAKLLRFFDFNYQYISTIIKSTVTFAGRPTSAFG